MRWRWTVCGAAGSPWPSSPISRATIWIFTTTFEDYFAAKRRLFEGTGAGAPAAGIINIDDAYGKQLVGLAAQHDYLWSGLPARK